LPELPEVETIRRGLLPVLRGRRIHAVDVRHRGLRFPLPNGFESALAGRTVQDIQRRAKYLLFLLEDGTLLAHLGMSGQLTLDPRERAHDHLVLHFGDVQLRFNDPRRFGWMEVIADVATHPRLRDLGPEPLSAAFTGEALRAACRGKRAAIKTTLLDARVVAGIGNIYACESLFRARVRPTAPAGGLSQRRYDALVAAIVATLEDALRDGGTTLRDYRNAQGGTGYFAARLQVYGREGAACNACGARIRRRVVSGRATFYCGHCQR
jgi:formamidopyrimidine-DNA glycosylase